MASPEKFRKTVIMIGLCLSSISEGYIFGQITGMVAGLLAEDSDVHMSTEEISWIASITLATCVVGFIVAAVITETFGRKLTITLLTAPIVVHWIVLYYAYNFTTFIIAKSIVGVCFGGVMSIIFISAAEYSNPTERASWLAAITTIGPSVGYTFGNILSIPYHWRTVALLGIIPSTLAALLPCFWIESPSWLASKGRFDECESAFTSLHGYGESANVELQLLISVEKRKRQQIWNRNNMQASSYKKLLLAMKQKYFWKLLLMGSVLNLFKTAGAKVQIGVFLIPILIQIAGRADTVIVMILNGCVIVGCCLSSILLRHMSVRPLLFSSGIISNIVYVILSICTYYNNKNIIYFNWVNITLLSLYFIATNAGGFPLSEALITELYPLEIKTYAMFIVGVIGGIMVFLSTKLAPAMFSTIGYHGVFMLNAVISSMCLIYFWFKLPETKGKSLQEIELELQNQMPENIILNDEENVHLTERLSRC